MILRHRFLYNVFILSWFETFDFFLFPLPFINFIFYPKSSLVSSRSFPLHFLFFFLSRLFIIIFRASFYSVVWFHFIRPSVRRSFCLRKIFLAQRLADLFCFYFRNVINYTENGTTSGSFCPHVNFFDAYTYVYIFCPLCCRQPGSHRIYSNHQSFCCCSSYTVTVSLDDTVVTGPFFLVLFSSSVVCVYTHY